MSKRTVKEISKFATILALFTIGLPIVGCQAVSENNSAIATSQKEMLLTQSGFRFKDVTTPKQQERVSQLAENKVSAVKYQGKLYYVYPTAKKDQILVGNQAQFNAYKTALQAQRANPGANQQTQMAPGNSFWDETAGPDQIAVYNFDGFGGLEPRD